MKKKACNLSLKAFFGNIVTNYFDSACNELVSKALA